MILESIGAVLPYSGIPIISGLVMSLIHVISGPDHLAAVLPLAVDSRKKSWSVGFSWGVGHTLGMLIIGLIFILIKENINVDFISSGGEKIVGFLLIGIGVWAIWKVFHKSGVHTHVHKHNGEVHVHEHKHDHAHFHLHKKTVLNNMLSALGIGIVHGVAGFSHLIMILPTLTLPSRSESVMYLSGFGIGTIMAMVIFAVITGWFAERFSTNKNIFNKIRIVSGILAIGVGIWWIIASFMIQD